MDEKERIKDSGQMTNDPATMQFGCHTEDTFRQMFHEDAQELFLRSVRGGLMGFSPEEGLPVYFISDSLLEELHFTYEQYIADCGGTLLQAVHPDDRADYFSAAIDFAENGGSFSQISRVRKSDGRYYWMRDVGKTAKTPDGSNIILILRSDFTDIIESKQELEKKAQVFEEKSRQLEALTANIPGGVCEVALDDNYTLVYGNEGFYKLFGYTPKQMREEKNNCLLNIIYEKDREYVKNTIVESNAENKQGFEFEHRIVKRDGTVVWIMVRCNFSNYQNHRLLNCVVLDITDRRKIEDGARMSEKRFSIALAQTDSAIFEYDIRTRVMIHSERSAEYYGLQQRTENVPDSLLAAGVVHPDSASVFLEMYDSIRNGAQTANCIIQAKGKDGSYEWRKITLTTIFDESGEPVQAVGFLENIDEQVRREESLRYQSERDSLTGLYNRGAMLSKLEHAIREGRGGAFFIIDIDSFKNINDEFGHMFGDFVLSEGAKRIESVCPDCGLIGRIGGDEFAVFLNNFRSAEQALACADQIVEAFQGTFEDRDIVGTVSCSVGLAISQCAGITFEELYQNADKALYEAKRAGKNRAVLYR